MRVEQTLNGYLLVRPRAAAEVEGIEIPDVVDKEAPTIGEVVVGTEKIEAGSIILFYGLSYRKAQHDGEELLLVHSDDVYAILEK